MIDYKEIGERIRTIRKSLKYKQEKLAGIVNVSPTTLSEIETGKSKPGFDFLYILSRKLNVNLYYVLFGNGEKFLDPLYSFTGLKFHVDSEQVENFFNDFYKSPLLQYHILGQYRIKMMTDGEMIEREIAEYKKKD
ncbi:MAG: helix-turn-helix transcriptional regulator [Candidatus Aminicenantes bacterium]|nr:helix-turn-helix transcriptional regulator [Candidatus Aminicenantes bacterium]